MPVNQAEGKTDNPIAQSMPATGEVAWKERLNRIKNAPQRHLRAYPGSIWVPSAVVGSKRSRKGGRWMRILVWRRMHLHWTKKREGEIPSSPWTEREGDDECGSVSWVGFKVSFFSRSGRRRNSENAPNLGTNSHSVLYVIFRLNL